MLGEKFGGVNLIFLVNRGVKLSKPNFRSMSLNELRKYVLANRDNLEAWDEFAARPRPNAVIVLADTPMEEQERIMKKLVDRSK